MMINNLPQYASEYEYIVAREVEDELWFWGAFSDSEKAEQVAIEVNGIVVRR